MTTLVRWNPFTDMSALRGGMDALEDFAPIRVWRTAEPAGLTFPTDLFETDDDVVVQAVLPGIKPEEVEIAVREGILTIKGEKHEQKTERDNYFRREIRYGAFSRSIPLPTRVNHEEAVAQFENGILTVTLPKAEEVRPKMIRVRAGGDALVGTGGSSN